MAVIFGTKVSDLRKADWIGVAKGSKNMQGGTKS
jgi:hypothetical protein